MPAPGSGSVTDISRYIQAWRASAIYGIAINWRYTHKRVWPLMRAAILLAKNALIVNNHMKERTHFPRRPSWFLRCGGSGAWISICLLSCFHWMAGDSEEGGIGTKRGEQVGVNWGTRDHLAGLYISFISTFACLSNLRCVVGIKPHKGKVHKKDKIKTKK